MTDGLAHMLDLLSGMGENLEASARLEGLDKLTPLRTRPTGVVVAGMGGSAIAADLIAPLAARQGLRVEVSRDYALPGWVRDDTLVLLSSYSGNTEETLSAARDAVERGCPCVALTSGGTLAELASGSEVPHFPCVTLPGGLPPRAALGHGLGAQLNALSRLGLLDGIEAEIAAAAAGLRDGVTRLGPATGEESPAKAAARRVLGRMLVVYTTSEESHAAGWRLKAQINENGKSPAMVVPFPELDHNDIVGWEVLRPRRRDFLLLILRSADEHPRTTSRVEITRDLLRDEFHDVLEFRAEGESILARILSLVQYGDYLSCYLAAAAGVDPMPVTRIDELKTRLRELDT